MLLSDPSIKWHVEDLSKEAAISIGQASRVKQALLSEEWVKEENKRFYLVKPEEVLNQWVNNYSYEKNLGFSFFQVLQKTRLRQQSNRSVKKGSIVMGPHYFQEQEK